MPMRPLTHATLLRKAFLRGETVNLTAFAKSRRGPRTITRSGLENAISLFGEMVRSDGQGNWSCVDLAAMLRFETPEREARNRRKREVHQRAKARASTLGGWGPLLAAWGLPLEPIDIDLPVRPHSMNTPEDNAPEPLAWMDHEHATHA